jgi:hypothetical protein
VAAEAISLDLRLARRKRVVEAVARLLNRAVLKPEHLGDIIIPLPLPPRLLLDRRVPPGDERVSRRIVLEVADIELRRATQTIAATIIIRATSKRRSNILLREA